MRPRKLDLGEYGEKELRITAQDSQKKDRRKELVFKHGKNHKWEINEVSGLKKSLRFSIKRSVDHVGMNEVITAVKMFNRTYQTGLNPQSVAESVFQPYLK